MSEYIEITDGQGAAAISLRGAELKSWRVGGQELMWSGDPAHWAETAPILFPVVGWTRDGVRVDGKSYPLGLHGFARFETFELLERQPNRVLLGLKASSSSLALYPFNFSLQVEFIIYNNELKCIIHVKNLDEKPMPYACGLHPGFRWPLPGGHGDHQIRFDAAEKPFVPVIAPGGLFSVESRAIPLQGRELPLPPNLFEEALCFLEAKSQGLEFFALDQAGAERPCLRMELQNFPHIALWSRPGAPFLCLEAWTGHGDPEGFSGDILAKPSMRLLAPGEKDTCSATFIWRA